MNVRDAICANDLVDRSLEDDEDNSEYLDGSCPDCGAGPDAGCDMDCGQADEDDEEEDL